MAEITTAVTDDEVVEHMRKYILPYIKDFQIVDSRDVLLSSSRQPIEKDVMNKLCDTLNSIVEVLPTNEVISSTKYRRLSTAFLKLCISLS